ncbi:MAG: hypothetical protein KAR56_00450 [Thermoplasmata archaeon]|nr:hypothetical protein [Thermoplasmata archaeon]
MAFCRYCGAQKTDENVNCSQCSGDIGQYYQPIPYGPPQRPSPDNDVGKALGIVALIIVIIIIVTVILAAVLYVVVIGFGSASASVSTPVGSWNGMEATSSTSGELTFGYFSEDVAPTDLQIRVQEGGSDAGYILWTDDASSTTVSMNWVNRPSGASAEYTDFNIAGGNVSPGDKITLYGLEPDTSYSIEVYNLPTDSIIYMGGTDSFITDP